MPAQKLGAEQKHNWVCKMCGFIEHNVVLYAKHLQEHYIKILNNSFICDICNDGFASEKVSLIFNYTRAVYIFD